MTLLTTSSCQPTLIIPPEPVDYCPLLPFFDNRAYSRINPDQPDTWGIHAWLYDMDDRLKSLNVLQLRFEHCVSDTLGGPPLTDPIIWEGGPNCVFDINSFIRTLNIPLSVPALYYTGTVEWYMDYGNGFHNIRWLITHVFNQPASMLWSYITFDSEVCEDVTYTEELANYQAPQWTLL